MTMSTFKDAQLCRKNHKENLLIHLFLECQFKVRIFAVFKILLMKI